MTRKEAIHDFLTKVSAAYIEDQQEKGIRASGKSAASFKPEATDSSGKLYAIHYLYFQKHGRGPGGPPSLARIIQWIKDKGITVTGKLEQAANAIRWSIARKGTRIYLKKSPALKVDDNKMTDLRKELVKNLITGEKQDMIKTIVDKLGFQIKQ
jgi:hypothetical protein